MLKLMSGGRIPKKTTVKKEAAHPSSEAVSAAVARPLLLAGRGEEGMRVLGHLDLSGSVALKGLPANLTCESLDISDCPNLTSLPPGLHVTHWIELAGSGITNLAAGHGFILRWRGVQVSDRLAFAQDLTGQDILATENVELRRLLLERLGYEKFLEQVGGIVRQRDRDAGGERQLIYVPFAEDDDEPLMFLKVVCPSTGHTHILRVPPHIRTCHQGAAWVAGFDNPDDYCPLLEA